VSIYFSDLALFDNISGIQKTGELKYTKTGELKYLVIDIDLTADYNDLQCFYKKRKKA